MSELPALSSHLPDIINLYISTRAQRLALDRQSAEIKEQEDGLAKIIISKYKAEDIKVLGAANGTVKMSTLKEPIATDWVALHKYIQETGHFEFLHRRISTLAIKEHWEAGEVIPGVGETEIFKLSVSKA